MADEKRTITTEYVAKLDRASFDKVSKNLDDQQKKQLKAAVAELKSQKALERFFDKQEDALKKANKAAKANTNEYKKQVTELDRLNDQFDKVSRNVGLAGDFQSNLGALRGISGLGGAGGLSTGLDAVGEFVVLAEELPRLKASVKGLPEVVKVAASEIGVAGLAIGTAVTLVVGGFALLQEQTRLQAEEFKKTASGFQELNLELQQGTLTTEEVQSRLAEVNVLRAAEQRNLEALEADYDHYISQQGLAAEAVRWTNHEEQAKVEIIEESRQAIKDFDLSAQGLAQTLFSTRIATNDSAEAVLDNADALAKQFAVEQRVASFAKSATEETLDARLEAIELEKEAVTTQQGALRSLLDSNTTQGDQARAKFETLADQLADLNTETGLLNGIIGESIRIRDAEKEAIEATKEAQKEAEAVNKQKEATLSRLNTLEAQSIKLLDDFARKQTETIQDRGLRDLEKIEDFNDDKAQAEAELNRDLLKISRDGNEQIIEARQAVTDYDRAYMQDTIKEHRDYNDEVTKLNRQRDLEDLQRRRQHLFDLQEAESNNDVLAFLRLQSQFKNEEQTRKENESLEDKERRDQLNKTLEDNRTAYLQRRQLLLQEVTERQNALRQSIAEARDKARIEADLKQAQFEKDVARQAQHDQIQDQRDRQALQRSLNAINVKAQAELTAIQAVTNAVSQLVAVANRISANTGNSQYTSTRSSGTTRQTYEQRLAQITAQNTARASQDYQQVVRLGGAYAKGGIRGLEVHKRPTLSLTGDGDKPEMIMPFSPSKGIQDALRENGLIPRGGMGGGVSVNAPFAPQITVSDAGLRGEINDALQSAFDNYTHQLGVGLTKAVNQSA